MGTSSPSLPSSVYLAFTFCSDSYLCCNRCALLAFSILSLSALSTSSFMYPRILSTYGNSTRVFSFLFMNVSMSNIILCRWRISVFGSTSTTVFFSMSTRCLHALH